MRSSSRSKRVALCFAVSMTRALDQHAKSLRRKLTPHEIRLWACIRPWREDGIRFRRQVVIGPYIVDFACYRPKVVVEVDGGQHTLDDHAMRDAERDAWLESQGFTVFRAWNHEVHSDIDAVIEGLRKVVDDKR